jgi:hypothetical protein
MPPCWTRSGARGLVALALVAVGTQACVSGHLLQAARRVEHPVTYREAFVDGDRLLLAYFVRVTDDDGRPHARRERQAAVALADLRRAHIPVDDFPLVRLADDAPLAGRRVTLHLGPIGNRDGSPALEIDERAGLHERFVLHDGEHGRYPPFHSRTLARTHTIPWVYALLPITVAIDLDTNPILLFFAPAVMVIGD